jgi:hypothetical protein
MNLPLEDMIQGVQCPQCNKFHMDRMHGTWICKHCGHISKEAHIPAIKDFFLLHGFQISNKQLRSFLLINSVYTGNRILQALELLTAGSTKDRIYSTKKLFRIKKETPAQFILLRWVSSFYLKHLVHPSMAVSVPAIKPSDGTAGRLLPI